MRTSGSMIVLLLALTSGCAHRTVQMTVAEQRELWGRARDLLIRAIQSDDEFVRANAIEALVDVAPEDGRAYFYTSLDAASPLVRFAACIAIGEIADPASLAAVRPALEDPHPRVRLAAAFAAYRCGEPRHARTLVDALNDHPDESMRADAAFLVGKLGETKAVKRLRFAAQREKSSKVLMHIYAAAAALGDSGARDELLRGALGAEPTARLLALQGLVEAADARSEEALLIRVREEGDYLTTRLVAARALGGIGNTYGYDLALRSLKGNEQSEVDTMRVRSAAALALGAIGDPRALPALRRLAERENDPRTQVAACYAICRILGN